MLIDRNVKRGYIFISYTIITSLLFGSIFYWNIFPECYIEGVGLTPFKINSEYVISLIPFSALIIMYRRRTKFDGEVIRWLSISIILTIFSELAFTFYMSTYGFSNLIGHLFKIIAFFLIYKSIIQVSMINPYSLIFRELKHSEKTLQEQAQALKESQAKLVQSERLASIVQIASIMAHELRNPLGAINQTVWFLKKRLQGSNDMKVGKHLDILEHEIIRSNKIISDLLDFAEGPKPLVRQKVDINLLVKKVVNTIEASNNIEKKINFAELPVIEADPEKIVQVLVNLISNGIQAMPEGGKLRVETLKENGFVKISVSDTGIGIPEANMDKLFTPLFSTKTKGAGLGLFLSRQNVERHGGTISVKSKVGKGSIFTISLPLTI